MNTLMNNETLVFGLVVTGLLIGLWLLFKSRQRLNNLLIANRQVSQDIEKQQAASETELTSLTKRLEERDEQLQKFWQQLEKSQQTANSMREQLGSYRVTAEKLQQQLLEVKDQLVAKEQTLQASQQRCFELNEQYARLQTSQKEKQAHFDQQLQLLEKSKQQLKTEFHHLANEIFTHKTNQFSELSKKSLDNLLSPVKQQLETFKSRIEDIHHKDTQQQSYLYSELKQLKTLNQQITAEAHNLATALKGRKKMQGNWGELLLENVLERSGLQAGKDYQRELSTYSMDGARARPDAVIYLPQNKHLIIDAKVSLNAYVRYINAEDEQQRQLALKQHVMAVSQRIKELAERDYYKLPRLNSPEVVFMFVPVESAFVDAVKAEPGLFQQAMDQRVLVTTPTTLLTSLTIVRQLWRYEHQNKHTAELVKSVENIFAKVNGFLTSFYGVKKGLDKAQECYLKAESQLVSGRSNLVKQVTDLKNLAPTIKGQLPDYFTEKAELEVEIPDTESAG